MPGVLLYGSVLGCTISTTEDLQLRMARVASRCQFVVMGTIFVQFQPAGATGAMVLAESHFTAHTWPELAVVDVDVHCCSQNFDPEECARIILEEFGGASMEHRTTTSSSTSADTPPTPPQPPAPPYPPAPITTTSSDSTTVRVGDELIVTTKTTKTVNGTVVSSTTDTVTTVNVTADVIIGPAFAASKLPSSTETLEQVLESDLQFFAGGAPQ